MYFLQSYAPIGVFEVFPLIFFREIGFCGFFLAVVGHDGPNRLWLPKGAFSAWTRTSAPPLWLTLQFSWILGRIRDTWRR